MSLFCVTVLYDAGGGVYSDHTDSLLVSFMSVFPLSTYIFLTHTFLCRLCADHRVPGPARERARRTEGGVCPTRPAAAGLAGPAVRLPQPQGKPSITAPQSLVLLDHFLVVSLLYALLICAALRAVCITGTAAVDRPE